MPYRTLSLDRPLEDEKFQLPLAQTRFGGTWLVVGDLCELLDGLEALLICCANGALAPPAVRVLCAARLFPLKKKMGV